jgi:IS30 family transposase
MSTTILSFQNRVIIETLHNEGRSLRYIANYLGFSKATIFNELHRLNSGYRAELAQTDFERKVSQRGRKSSLTKNLKHLIEEKIQVQKWSPEQVAHVVGITYKTVYNWIDQGWLDVQLPNLPDHGIRRHRAKEKRGTFSHVPPRHPNGSLQRPEAVEAGRGNDQFGWRNGNLVVH